MDSRILEIHLRNQFLFIFFAKKYIKVLFIYSSWLILFKSFTLQRWRTPTWMCSIPRGRPCRRRRRMCWPP